MRTALVGLILASSVVAQAGDVPVRGDALQLRASARNPDRRAASVRLADATIAGPFGDPRADVAILTLHGGAAAGQCFVRASLPADRWRPIGGNGPRRGWRYRDPAGRVAGIRRVVVRRGTITVTARGPAWPCPLAEAARLPVTVALRLGTGRWCGAFGGRVAANLAARFRARAAPPPAACPDADVTVANLNVLHGLSCAAPTDACRFPARAALLRRWLEGVGCPDVVTLQEVREAQVPTLLAALDGACGDVYQASYLPTNRVDDGLVLATAPAIEAGVVRLLGDFRNLLHVRLDHLAGPLDVFTTHLAARIDGALQPCAPDCPAECSGAGAQTRRECQAVQVARLVEARRRPGGLSVLTGDFNEEPGSFVHGRFTGAGWLDVHLAAGNPECDPATGEGCTSGRADDVLDELESPARNQDERIDFIFVQPAAGCAIEPAGDPDGDAASTGPFAHLPNPFVPACGPAPAPICWPSDHGGVQLDLECG